MKQDVIDVAEAEVVLKGMLASARANVAAPDLRQVWSVFKDFCLTVQVRTPSDIVAFAFFGPRQLHLHFWRQFDHPEVDDLHEPIVLDCEFRYEPVDELRRLGEWNRLSGQEASLEDFFAAVEGQPFLETASRYRPVDVKIFQMQI